METLYGTPRQNTDNKNTRAPAPIVYARAALFFPDETGRRTLSDDLLIEAARRFKRGDGPLDLVLVTDDAALALVSRLPTGFILAGIVAEKNYDGEDKNNAKIAVVAGVPGLQNAVHADDLLIVDGEKSRVLVEPEAEEFVRLQTERHRARLLLGAAHTSAQTLAGRSVSVWAAVQNARDVEGAISGGADGIVIQAGGDLLDETLSPPPDDDNPFPDPDDAPVSLLHVVEAVGGGAVGLLVPFGILEPPLILGLAGVCELRWAVSPGDLPLSLPEVREEMADLLKELDAEGRAQGAVPQFAALPQFVETAGEGDAANENLAAFDEVWLTPNLLETLSLGDIYALPPVRVLLSDLGDAGALDLLPDAVALGASGVVVAPALVEQAKDLIRQQPN